jgi:hypothetical protein
MKVTYSVDDDILAQARRCAEAMGTSVNQLVRDYLAQLAGRSDAATAVEEFVRLSHASKGNSHAWRFNREEAHER